MDLARLSDYFGVKESLIEKCLELASKRHRVSKKQVYEIVLRNIFLTDLPNELHFEIIKNLPIKDILRLCSTSRRFKEFCDNERLWSYLLKRDFGVKLPKSNEKDSKKRYIELYRTPKVQLSCGSYHTGAITTKGLYMWGENRFGQIGNGTKTATSALTKIDIPGKPLWLSCGYSHTGAITTKGLYMWGYNKFGQLGNSTTEDKLLPTKIEIPGKPLWLSCGPRVSGAITTEGLYMWGWNLHGQLGDGTTEDKLVPTKIEIPGKPLSVSCGEGITGAITTKGLYMWGKTENIYFGTESGSLIPTRVKIPGKPLQISLRFYHVGVITTKGLYMWGNGHEGQLGAGKGIWKYRKNPTEIKVPGNPLQISCGNAHTGTITTKGLYMWGDNRYGQIGMSIEYAKNKFQPEIVSVPGNPLFLSCGADNTGVITTKGLYMWGDNVYGQSGESRYGYATVNKINIPGEFV